jgi:hypothetical protein
MKFKAWLLYFVMLLSVVPLPGQEVVTALRHPTTVVVTWTLANSTANFGCPTTGVTCVITIPSTTSGNLLVISIESYAYVAGGWTLNSINAGGTLGTCTAHACALADATNGQDLDAGWVLSATGSVTSITATISAASSSGWLLNVDEWHCAGCGTISTDGSCAASGCTSDVASCTSCTGAAISSLVGPSGTDLLVQIAALDHSFVSVSSPYASTPNDVSLWAQSTIGTAPTITQSPGGYAMFTAVAFQQ